MWSTQYRKVVVLVVVVTGLVCIFMPMPWNSQKRHEYALVDTDMSLDRFIYTVNPDRPSAFGYPVKRCPSKQTYVDFGSTLTQSQKERVELCMTTYEHDTEISYERELVDRKLRYTSHSYLNNRSFVIEAGGHLGIDVNELNSRYHPGKYVVLEPVKTFYNILKDKFKDSPNVIFYNFGIDVRDGMFYVDEDENDAASIFVEGEHKGNGIQIMNATNFFEKISVRRHDVDLITLNCEGCEYAILDLLLSTDYIQHFKNIQFQPHRIEGICHPVRRYCWYQELLKKTHMLSFQFKFVWENWKQIL